MKQKLFAPEVETLVRTFNLKADIHDKQIKEVIDRKIKELESKFSLRLSMVEEMELQIQDIGIKHKKFVHHLEDVLNQISDKFEVLKKEQLSLAAVQ